MKTSKQFSDPQSASDVDQEELLEEEVQETGEEEDQTIGEGMDLEGYAGPKVVQPLTPEALARFNAAQARTGVIYISRIPPGMRPAKVRHLMSAHGEVGRVYLQQEGVMISAHHAYYLLLTDSILFKDAKRAFLRRKYTSTKKPHFTEGWVEFKDKKVARSVAEMLNAQPIGGKKGTRWRDDVWTMKYLPKFKWNMLTEQIGGCFSFCHGTDGNIIARPLAHEAAIHAAKLRVELAQSKSEQHEYLKNVELARVLDKRNERRKEKGLGPLEPSKPVKRPSESKEEEPRKRKKLVDDTQLDSVLGSIF